MDKISYDHKKTVNEMQGVNKRLRLAQEEREAIAGLD